MSNDTKIKPRYDLLLRLCDKLEKLPRSRFDYSTWVDTEKWKGKVDLSCGTTACALGWATTIPSIRKQGLKLSRIGSVLCKGGYAELAASIAFGISNEDASFLFYPGSVSSIYNWQSPGQHATAKQVAAHIRRFVNAHKVLHNDLHEEFRVRGVY